MKQAIAIFLAFVVAQIVAAALGTVISRLTGGAIRPLPVTMGYSLLVCSALLALVLRALGLIRFKTAGRRAPLCGAETVCTAIGGLLFCLGLSFAISPLGLSDDGSTALFQAMKASPAGLLLMVAVAPLVEELVFREGIVRQLVLAGTRPVVAVAASAAAFALVHGNAAQALPAFVIGIVLGACYLRTGDIRLSFPLHALNNLGAVGLMFCPGIELRLSQAPTAVVVGAAAVVAVIGAAGVWLVCGRSLLATASNARTTLQPPTTHENR